MSKAICCLLGLSLTGCSHDYAPTPDEPAEHIFKSACLECHKPANNNSVFQLKPENANSTYISHKIQNGSLLMPAFPRFTAHDVAKTSHYVLEHSATLQ